MGIRIIEKPLTVFSDLLAINIAFFAAVWLRYVSHLFPETYTPHIDMLSFINYTLFLINCMWIFLFFVNGLYREWYRESRFDEFILIARTVAIGILFVFVLTSSKQIIEFASCGDLRVLFTRTKVATLMTYGGCMLFFSAFFRLAIHSFLFFLFSRGIGISKVLIIGANRSGKKLVREIHAYARLGYRVCGFIDDDKWKKDALYAGYKVLGTYADLPSVVKKQKIPAIIITHLSGSANEILKILNHCGELKVTIYMVPSLVDVITGHLKTHQVFGIPLLVLLQDHMAPWEAQVKRLLDIIVSGGILIAGAPLWLAVAALIRVTSQGRIIYRQTRVGRNGKNFTMYKFRSMYRDAERRSGPTWASKNDPRITPLGRFLRTTRIDEIPQFWNVLVGDMSIVGPRPERPFFVEKLKNEIPWYIRRIKMKPGITGWAQVKHKYDASIEDVRQKVIYDLYYFENMSLALDIKIVLQTLLVVLTGRGAH